MYSILMNRSFMPAVVPRAGLVISTALSIVSMCVLAVCLSRRLKSLRRWRDMKVTHWMILVIYIDSMLFVSITAVLSHGFGLNSSPETCSAAILLCLTCYMSTKIFIYYLFVEKVNIVNAVSKKRLESKLYIFNCFGMLVPYCIVVILNFVFRIAIINKDGVCIIGMEKKAMLPLIIFDVVVNVYLTTLFIIPLRRQYSYKNAADSMLRTVTLKTFIGSISTLLSSVVNLTILMVLKGEPAWICLMCCNADILFSVLVLHWVTNKDGARRGSSLGKSHEAGQQCNTCNVLPLNEYNPTTVYPSVHGERVVVRSIRSNLHQDDSDLMKDDDEEQMIPDGKRPQSLQVTSVKSETSWPENEEENKKWPNDNGV